MFEFVVLLEHSLPKLVKESVERRLRSVGCSAPGASKLSPTGIMPPSRMSARASKARLWIAPDISLARLASALSNFDASTGAFTSSCTNSSLTNSIESDRCFDLSAMSPSSQNFIVSVCSKGDHLYLFFTVALRFPL